MRCLWLLHVNTGAAGRTSLILVVNANVIQFCPVFSCEVAVFGLSHDTPTETPHFRRTMHGVIYW